MIGTGFMVNFLKQSRCGSPYPLPCIYTYYTENTEAWVNGSGVKRLNQNRLSSSQLYNVQTRRAKFSWHVTVAAGIVSQSKSALNLGSPTQNIGRRTKLFSSPANSSAILYYSFRSVIGYLVDFDIFKQLQ